MKKIIVTVGLIVVLLGGTLVAAPSFIDWNKYRSFIVGRLHDATGYDYEIGGALEMRVVPYPRLSFENLTVTAPGRAAKPLLTLGRAEVSVALLPLLTGKVVVKSIELDRPQIELDVAADGTQSWMTPALKAKLNGVPATPGAQKNGPAVAMNDITVKDGSFIYNDAGAKKTTALSRIDMDLHADTLNGPFTADGTLVYGGQAVKLKLSADRLEGGADSAALKATIEVPSSSSKITYSGAVGLRGDHEIQGETDIETLSLKKLAAFAGQNGLPPALDKPFSAQGMLTVSASEFSYKNTKFILAGSSFTGRAGISNLKAAGGKPVDVDIALVADKAVDLNKLMPAADNKKADDKAADGEKAGMMSFLPSTLTLPARMNATVTLTAPAMHYKTADLTAVELDGNWKDQKAGGEIKATLPDGGSLDVAFGLVPGSVSQSVSGNTVTLADPALNYTLSLKTADGQKTLALLLPPDKMKSLDIVQGALSVTGTGTVRPGMVDVTQATINLLNATINLSGSYTPKKSGGRDFIRVAASAAKIDLDDCIDRLMPASAAPAAAAAPATAELKKTTQKLVLPFDLDLSLTASDVKYKGTGYDKLALMVLMTDKKLTLKTLQMQDHTGNNLLAAGGIGDVTTLSNLDLSFQGKTGNLKKILTGFAPKLASLPDTVRDAEIVAEFKGQADSMDFTANVKAMSGSIDATGTVVNVLDKPAFTSLTLRAKHPNYVDVVRLFQPDFHGSVSIAKGLDLFASMKREKDVYSFTDMQATVGPATFSGDVTADVSGAVPDIKAKLQLGDVALDQLTGHDSLMQGAVQAQREGNGTSPSGGRWSRDPFDYSAMRKFNLDLTASAKSLSYQSWQISNASAQVTLKDGTLNVADIAGTMYGGKVALQGKVIAPDKPHLALTVDGTAAMNDVALQSFVAAFSGANLVKAQGNISLNADIKTTGASAADLVSALDGSGKASGKNIVFDGFDLARLSRTLTQPSGSLQDNLSSLVGAAMGGGTTTFDTLDSSFTIKQGIAKVDPLNLTGKAASVASPGTLDLPLWTINMESTITLTDAKDAPPLKVAIKGPLDQPAKAFGKSALDSYFGSKIGALLGKALKKGGLEPAVGNSGTVAATPLIAPSASPLSPPSVNTVAPAAAPDAAVPTTPPAATPDTNAATPAAPAASTATPPTATPPVATAATTPPPAAVPTAMPPPDTIKPKDAFKNLLQGVTQGAQ